MKKSALLGAASILMFSLLPGASESKTTVAPLVEDANTVLLDHFDNSTGASILGYSEDGSACSASTPENSATPAYSYGTGLYGLSQALFLSPPAGQPVGSASYLQYPGGEILSLANGTVEFWVYLDAYGDNGLSLADQGRFYNACEGWTFQMGVTSSGQLAASAWNAFTMNSGAATVPLHAWTHVAATWGSTGAKLYINGHEMGGDPSTGSPASGYGGSLLIRAGSHGGMGGIDELRISNIQRTWSDLSPDAFALIDQVGMPLNASIESNPITVSGFDLETFVTITGGEYAISTDGGATWSAWTSADGWLRVNDQVRVRQTSSPGYSTKTTATLTVGGFNEAFEVTTAEEGDPRASGLVGWWRGEGNPYDSVGGHHGTVHGGTSYVAGKIGQGFSFNGSSGYLSTADSGDWDVGAGDFTIEAWISTPTPSNTMRLLAAGCVNDGANSLWAFGYGSCEPYWGTGPHLNLAYYDGSGYPYTDLSSSAISLPAGTLCHIVLVRQGTDLAFYLNGGSVGSAAIGSVSLSGGSTGAIIGARYGGDATSVLEYANGVIDELRFYNRALSADEVAFLNNSVTVSAPNGGETWVTGETHDITWTSSGAIASVDIGYSIDNGDNWTVIASNVANDGSESWTVPYALSGQCLVGVGDAANAAIYDYSDAAFTIRSDAMEPNDDSGSAAVLPIGATENLAFDGGDLFNVDWYKFFVPAESAGQDLRVNVRVTSPYPDPIPSPEWASDLDFELLDASLRVLGCTISRSDNETLCLHNVSSGWYYIHVGYCTTEYADATDHAHYAVTLETGTGFGLGYVSGRLLDGSGDPVANEFIFLDPVPNDWSVSRPYLASGTDGNFTIAAPPGTYTLLFNNAGPYICANYTYESPNVVAEYYSGKKTPTTADAVVITGGGTVNLGDIALADGAIVSGHVTNLAAGNMANVQVRSYDSGGNTFNYELVLTDAAGNYTLKNVPPEEARIRFSRSGYATEFYDDKPTLGSADILATVAGGTTGSIDAQMGAGGTISGTVTDGLGAGIGGIRVSLYSALDGTAPRASLLTASGTGAFSFARTFPGEYKIHCDPNGLNYAQEWYNDAASFAEAAIVSVGEGGTTPGIEVQLQSVSITVTSPNGGESWAVGNARNITWASSGGIASVNIDYSTDDGANWISIAAGEANDGSYAWTVPDTPSSSCRVRVSDAADGNPAGQSGAPFSILPLGSSSITVTVPNGGETYAAGGWLADVNWTSTGSIALVDIEYSTDGGSSWTTILSGTANDGHSGDFLLPNTVSVACLVRVSDSANPALFDASDSYFTIGGDDAYEDNDTLATAAALLPGYHCGLGLRDHDYFKVYVEEGKDLQVSVNGSLVPPASGGDMDITLYDAAGQLLVTSIGGSASETLYLSDLAAGWYFIHNQYWGDDCGYALYIASGDLPLGTISGRVTDIRGAGIANLWVTFYDLSGTWNLVRGYVPTDGDGDYRFAYAAGDHKLLIDANYPTNQVAGSYISEWYNDVATFADGQTLSTAAGGALTGIDVVLADGGMVTGVVTGPGGQPLHWASVSAWDAGGNYRAATNTLADGSYRLRGIPASGNYTIRFRPSSSSQFAVEWYNDKGWSGAADPVAVVLREETPGINAQLANDGTISGQVTDAVSGLPVANVTVVARDEGNIGINSAKTGADGNFTISWIPACNVKLFFDAGTTGYVSEWYSGKDDFTTADLVPVGADQDVTGMNAELALPSIAVTAPNGGENWIAGSNQSISWTAWGAFTDVKIEYSTDLGANYSTIVASTANMGSYEWTVPATPSANCLVRVSDAADGIPADSSNAAFAISAAPAETVSMPTAPAGPATGMATGVYAFGTGGAVSNLGHAVQYKFDWGDGSDSGWLATGTTSAAHGWVAAGAYSVRAMARCAGDTAVESSWSGGHAIAVSVVHVFDGHDFNGNGSSDVGVFRPANNFWYIRNVGSYQWGAAGDKPASGDYDHDGVTDVAIFRPAAGKWIIRRSTAGTALSYVWGGSTDVPAPGDYDGDGITDVGVWRPATAKWMIKGSAGTNLNILWGANGDIPAPGDYDGDGKADLATFRPSNNKWYIRRSSNGTMLTFSWGAAGDIEVHADFDGDGLADAAVFRPSQGKWYVRRTSNGTSITYAWGASGDVPAPGDYDGDGKADAAVFKPAAGKWYVRSSYNGSTLIYTWGASNDISLVK